MNPSSKHTFDLSPERRALLDLLLEENGVEATHTRQQIPRRKGAGPAPLSFAQQRMWFLDQLEPNNPFYNIAIAFRLTGPLNATTLEQSINEIGKRHESLRTTFPATDGQPRQVVAPSPTISLAQIDLRHLPEAERWTRALDLANEEARQPFDLSYGPLWRTTLLQLAAQEHLLIVTVHHIVADEWSTDLFFEELAAHYRGFSTAQPCSLPGLPIRYADFAAWQQKWLESEAATDQLAYWKQQLFGAPPVLELPADHPRPPVQSYRGAFLPFTLPPTLSVALKTLSRQEGVTLFMTILAAFTTLLHRYTGQDDIVVGSPIANRSHPELENLIGCFLNTLALRTDLSGDPTFRQLLARVREIALQAYAHQDLPFEKLVDELEPERDMSYPPLFQVMLVFQSDAASLPQLPGLDATPLHLDKGTAKFDLTLYLADSPQGLTGSLEYSTDLFDRATITRMLGNFQMLLESVVENPDRRITDLPLLTAPERQQLLMEWNDTRKEYPTDSCLHQFIEAQVELTPDAVAVVFENRQLTYRELNRRASQLAHHLQALGVGPEVLVGICAERSLELVVGLLGILEAGGAYVPLDPTYPQERLAFMMQDAGMPVLLTQERLRAVLPQHGAKVVYLDSDWAAIAQEREENPTNHTVPENAAYLIYTSGSTGKPKGAINSHRGICNRLLWMQDEYQLTEDDRILQKTPFSFDVSVWEFFWPLMTGACLVVARPEGHKDSAYLVSLIVEQEITTMHFVPPMLQAFLEEPQVVTCHSLRQVICSGEALPFDLQERFFARMNAELDNLYGPTEAAVDVTCWPCERESARQIVPIGRPIANTQIHLLDKRLQPVPIGVPGELHIGGVGLARGYLNKPALTAEKFIPNPFSDRPGARLYKTGDLARYLPDGNIEFLGRIDHQVKIRGFRIELGEIEAVLSQHPAVRETVVLAREDTPGHKRLAAYVVGSDQAQPPSVRGLRGFLKERLPDYMLPATFVFLEAMPLTPNGKVDRRALPAPDRTRPELEETFVAPRTAAEETLTDIWSQLLGLEKVGIHDNFFELGGDSILSLQIIARAGQAGLRLTPRQIFQHQTIAELAAVADTTPVALAVQGPVIGPAPLTPIQHWFFEQNLLDPHHWNQAVLLEVRQELAPVTLEQALQKILTHHDALRLRYEPEESGWRQHIANPGQAAPLTSIDLSALPEEEQDLAIAAAAADLQASLDLVHGPLFRAALFDLGPRRTGRLLIVIHHLAVDGVSWRILLEDLQTACRQLGAGKLVALPAKTTSFKHWAGRLLEHARSAELQRELDYWLAMPQTKAHPLPLDDPQDLEANTIASARVVSVSLSAEETRALLQEVPGAYHTQINDVLLTALLQAFAQWTGAHSLLLDLEGHGREPIFDDVDLSRTVGWFTTIFPVLLDLGEADAPGDALKSVKEQLRCVPHGGIGYGLLRYLGEDDGTVAKLEALPQAEVLFNYLGQWDQALPDEALFGPAPESSGPAHSSRGARPYLLEINSSVEEGCLRLGWRYSEHIHQRATIERLAQGFVEALQALIAHCRSVEVGSHTPSDFPLVEIDQQSLDRLVVAHSPIEDIYPPGPMQQHMLFHRFYKPEPGLYVLHHERPVTGIPLDLAAFERAWQAVVDRQPILRTSFVADGLDEPLQVVHKEVQVPVEYQDWRGLPPPEQEEKLRTLVRQSRQRGFEPSATPHLRLTVIQMDEDTYQFLMVFSYIQLDGWSHVLVLKEFLDLYTAFSRDQEPHLKRPRPYRDYIAWAQEQDLAKAERFWRKTLEGFTEPISLTDHPSCGPTGQKDDVCGKQVLALSTATTAALESLARRHQLTLNTMLQGAWAMLLSRCTGRRDVVFGGLVSGRPAALPEIESMVGLFINVLPVRVQVSPPASLLPWLKAIQDQQVEQRQYQYSPPLKVKEWSDVQEDLPLFEDYLVFQNFPVDASLQDYADNWGIGKIRAIAQTEHPLRVEAYPMPAMPLIMTYHRHRFDDAKIEAMLRHFKTLLEGFATSPERRLGALMSVIER